MIEDSAITYGETTDLPTTALFSPEQYAQRFDELLEKGYGWVHLNAVGTLDEALIVSVTWPREAVGAPREWVSVNLSWPGERDNILRIID